MNDCEASGNTALVGLEMVKCASMQSGTWWIAPVLLVVTLCTLTFIYFKNRD